MGLGMLFQRSTQPIASCDPTLRQNSENIAPRVKGLRDNLNVALIQSQWHPDETMKVEMDVKLNYSWISTII